MFVGHDITRSNVMTGEASRCSLPTLFFDLNLNGDQVGSRVAVPCRTPSKAGLELALGAVSDVRPPRPRSGNDAAGC